VSDDPKLGIDAAIARTMDLLRAEGGAGEHARAAEQLSLLPTPAIAAELEERRGPGRPRGSINRSTEEMARYILAHYRDPRLFLAELYNRPVEQLARELNTTREKAQRLQIEAADKLMPYVASKMPVAVTIDAAGEVSLTIVTTPPARTVENHGLIIDVESEVGQPQLDKPKESP